MMYIMVNGKTIKPTVMAHMIIVMEPDIKDTGRMINKMDKVKKSGRMVHVLQDNTKMVKSMVSVVLSGQIEAAIKEISKTII